MQRTDMKKYMLLKKEAGADTVIYRVLELAEKILVLDCVKKTMPVWKTYEELQDFVEVKEEQREADNLATLEDMDADSRKTAYQRFNLISGILPFLANEKMRAEAITRIAEENEVTAKTVRKYLCEYLATMDIRSLAPKQKEKRRNLLRMNRL